jgi:4-alpha-glucanotransferase
VLRELGAPLDDDGGPDALEDALRAVRTRRWERALEPVTVAWEGDRPAVTLRLPRAETGTPLELRVALEDGGVAERRVQPHEIGWEDEARVDGRPFTWGTLALPDLPVGWHDVSIRTADREASTRLIRAPRSTWDGPAEAGGDTPDARTAPPDDPATARGWRAWGAFLPLHALRTARDRGVGDLGDLERLALWTRERGGAFVGTLPLLAAFLGGGHGAGAGNGRAEPFEPSPYAPVSRLFWNELHLDLDHAPGLEAAPDARRVLDSAGHRSQAERLRAADRLDHRAVMAHKRRVLEPLARAVAGPGGQSGLAGPLGRFAGERPDALDYACFRAYGEAVDRPWSAWPEPAASGALEAGAAPADRVRYHLYVQWAMEQQLARLTGPGRSDVAGLYLDLPLGSHPRGYDVWRHRDAFATGASGGAPPDAFFAGGQDWGFPPLHPARSRDEGHAYFAASLRHLMGVADVLRIDHVMSLHRLFWVPAGGAAADGVYVRYPSEELWAALCLESRRHRCEVVGEDLGTVPAEVRREMERRGARRMWVLPFEVGLEAADDVEGGGPDRNVGAQADDDDGAGAGPAARSVAYVDTHDLPPFAAFWRGRDIEERVERGHLGAGDAEDERRARRRWRGGVGAWLGGLDPDDSPRDVLDRVLLRLAGSPARLLMVNLEDLWLEERPQNVPGTASPENWTLRAARTLEELAADDGVEAVLREIDDKRRAPSDEGDR